MGRAVPVAVDVVEVVELRVTLGRTTSMPSLDISQRAARSTFLHAEVNNTLEPHPVRGATTACPPEAESHSYGFTRHDVVTLRRTRQCMDQAVHVPDQVPATHTTKETQPAIIHTPPTGASFPISRSPVSA